MVKKAMPSSWMIRVVNEIINNCTDYEVCTVIGDGIMPENRLDLDSYARRFNISADDVSNLINNSLRF